MFKAVMIDPPWHFNTWADSGVTTRHAQAHYPTMNLGALKMLPVEKLFAPDCAVFLWACWPLLQEAIDVGRAWGLKYKTCAFNWVKMNKRQTEKPFTGLGYWTRGNSEPCLLFTRGRPKRISKGVPQIFLEWGDFQTETIATPIRAHSQKPDAVRERIEQLVEGPYLELFGREASPGWHVMGNALSGLDIREEITAFLKGPGGASNEL